MAPTIGNFGLPCYTQSNGRMIYERLIRKELEGRDNGLNRGTESNHEKSVKTAGDPAKIRAKYLHNTSLQCYSYASLLGKFILK